MQSSHTTPFINSQDTMNTKVQIKGFDQENRIKVFITLKQQEDIIKFIRILWVDVANIIRCKSIRTKWLLENQDDYVCVTSACMALPGHSDSIVPPALPSQEFSEVFLIPDWSTFTILPYTKGTAQVFGSFHSLGIDVETGMTRVVPWNLCPRYSLLQAELALSKCKPIDQQGNPSIYNGFKLKGSFEEEFYLLKPNNSKDGNSATPSPSEFYTFASCYSLDENAQVLHDIADSLESQGVPIEQLLSESGPGQFEVTIPYTDILTACDRHIIVRQTIHAVAHRHGYIASFLPKVYKNVAGNGCHLHLSLWSNNESSSSLINTTPMVDRVAGISHTSIRAISGVLEHAQALTSIFNANVNSYSRLTPNSWSGGAIAWGVNNKEALVRVPTSASTPFKGNSNFEIKSIDHSTNPYLAVSAIIYAMIDGMTNSNIQTYTPTSINPSSLSEEERKKLRILPIPSSLDNALYHLEKDDYLIGKLGKDLSNAFIHVKRQESKDFVDKSFECVRDTFLKTY